MEILERIDQLAPTEHQEAIDALRKSIAEAGTAHGRAFREFERIVAELSTMVGMKAFLLEHDRHSGHTKVRVFDDNAKAFAELRLLEAAREDHMEVVLMFADSEEDLRNTHSRYFYGMKELVRRGWNADPIPGADVAAG